MNKSIYFGFLMLMIFVSCNNNREAKDDSKSHSQSSNPVPLISYQIVRTYPHDITSFTEGFLFHNGQLYESTGAPENMPQTRSLFGSVDLNTGKIDVKVELDKEKFFGEGITFLNGKVYQLTYQTKVGFIYDEKTFRKSGEFIIPTKEGWGMTTDGVYLIMTDGTNLLTYLDANSLNVVKTVAVSENGYAKDLLNEPEFIHGSIYANIYTTNEIVKIDPQTGKITAKLDLTALAEEAKLRNPRAIEMNGIAYDSIADKILITGKLWSNIYEIKFDK